MQRVWSTYLDNGVRRHIPAPPEPSMDHAHYSRDSVASHAHSTISQANSTRPILAGHSTSHTMVNSPLEPPSAAPFMMGSNKSDVSLTVNYIPSKFSSSIMSPGGVRKRKGKGIDPLVPKRGGGVEAFRSGESRMPGERDVDYDGVETSGWFSRSGGKRLRWTKFKWILFFANTLLTCYSLVALIFCLLTWFNVWKHADVVRVANRPELIISTLAASVGVLTSLIGWAGILLNNRSFLAIFTFLLWIVFAFLVTPGYISYKQRTFNLEGKINAEWSRSLGADGRLRVQNELGCCGYFSPFVEATVSETCYARSVLPGCKNAFFKFEKTVLTRWYIIAFALVPVHIGIICAGLFCSNHVTYRFGKGMMPKAYRLSMNSMAVIMDNYANQLAEQYGSDVAQQVLARSRSNLNLAGGAYDSQPPHQWKDHRKYDSLGSPAPESAS